jgi:hypothetical protein
MGSKPADERVPAVSVEQMTLVTEDALEAAEHGVAWAQAVAAGVN